MVVNECFDDKPCVMAEEKRKKERGRLDVWLGEKAGLTVKN